LHTKNLKLHLMILKTKYVLIKQEVIVYNICLRAPDGTASNEFVNIKTRKYSLKKQYANNLCPNVVDSRNISCICGWLGL